METNSTFLTCSPKWRVTCNPFLLYCRIYHKGIFEAVKLAGGGLDIYGSECTTERMFMFQEGCSAPPQPLVSLKATFPNLVRNFKAPSYFLSLLLSGSTVSPGKINGTGSFFISKLFPILLF